MKTELDDKYIVINRKDCERYLDPYEQSFLWNILATINDERLFEGKGLWKGQCIRNTWPEYEEVKAKLLERINREV